MRRVSHGKEVLVSLKAIQRAQVCIYIDVDSTGSETMNLNSES